MHTRSVLDPFTPDQLSAFWDGVSGIATAIAAAVAIFTLRSVRQDSADRSRPVMSADLRPVVLSRGVSELVVENLGQSVAKHVKVSFNPPLPDLQGVEAEGKVTPFLQRRYSRVIPSIPPGRQLFNVYSIGVDAGDGDRLVNDEPTPDDITVRLEYEDARGRKFTDSYDLSLNALNDETEHGPSNTDEKGLRRREVRALEATARSLHRRG